MKFYDSKECSKIIQEFSKELGNVPSDTKGAIEGVYVLMECVEKMDNWLQTYARPNKGFRILGLFGADEMGDNE